MLPGGSTASLPGSAYGGAEAALIRASKAIRTFVIDRAHEPDERDEPTPSPDMLRLEDLAAELRRLEGRLGPEIGSMHVGQRALGEVSHDVIPA